MIDKEDMKLLLPKQEVEFSEEFAGDDAIRIKVKLDKNADETFDPASYVEHKWVKTNGDRYVLRIKNITGSPVYVTAADANS